MVKASRAFPTRYFETPQKIRARSHPKDRNKKYQNLSYDNKERKTNVYSYPQNPGKLLLLWIKSEGICHLCDKPLDRNLPYGNPMRISIDHLIPRNNKGSNDISNLKLAHAICNSLRGHMSLDEWFSRRVRQEKARKKLDLLSKTISD